MSKTILVVDDDKGVVRLLEKVLTEEGFNVAVAEDGLDAIVLIEKSPPDLMILDVMMPEVNGYDVCFHVKFNEKYKSIPIILLTVRKREINFDISEKAGIEYLHKPVETDAVLTLVRKVFGGAQ